MTGDVANPTFVQPSLKNPGDITAKHQMRWRRMHTVRSVWCTCGWTSGPPRKMFHRDMATLWRNHLDEADTPVLA